MLVHNAGLPTREGHFIKEANSSLKIIAKTVSTHVRGDEDAGPSIPRYHSKTLFSKSFLTNYTDVHEVIT